MPIHLTKPDQNGSFILNYSCIVNAVQRNLFKGRVPYTVVNSSSCVSRLHTAEIPIPIINKTLKDCLYEHF